MDRVETIKLSWEETWSLWKDRVAGGLVLPLFFALVACGVIVLLLLVILWMTFVPGLPTEPGFDLSNYTQVLGDRLLSTVGNTVLVGFGSTAFALFWSVSMAWLIHRTDMPWKPLLMAAIAVSVLIPGFMKAMGWILLLSPKIGLINLALMNLLGLEDAPLGIYNRFGIIFVQGLMLTPTMFFLISGPMRSMDPALEESSEVTGVNKWKTQFYVTLPLMWPAIFSGAIYIFMTAVSIYEVPALLVGFGKYPLLSTAIFLNTAGTEQATKLPQYGMAGVYGLLITIPSIVALFFYLRLIKQSHRYAVVTGRGYRPKLFPLGRLKYLGSLFVLIFVILAVILPFSVLLWASLLPSLKMPSREALSYVTLEYYSRIGQIVGADVIRNTVLLMAVAPLAVLFLALMISWIVVRSRLWGRGAIDTITMLPHAIPGIGFAFALVIVAMLTARWFPWIPLYGTIWVIILANVVNRLAYATRVTNAALLQVSQELEDAAAICGVGKLRAIRRIMVPLITPSLLFAGVWTTMLVFREVSMALMLSNPGNIVFSVHVWTRWQSGAMSEAAAMGVVMVTTLGVIFLIAQSVFRGRLYGIQGL